MPLKPTSIKDLEYIRRVREDFQWKNPEVHEEWRWEGLLHSVDDHPAVIIAKGRTQFWYTHGVKNRPEHLGPAGIEPGIGPGTLSYYKMGHLHRDKGPALISAYESKWYQHGLIHRADGPAVITHQDPNAAWNSARAAREFVWYLHDHRYDNMNEWGEESGVDPELFVLLKLKYA